MADNNNSVAGFNKDPLTTCHGDSLVDQSFQSLKSKEVRDSMSPPHDLKFHSLSLNQPNTTGWDVQTSSEVSPDGRAYRTETVAKTDGVEKLNGGGLAEFKGRNEQSSSASHQGDDRNFVKKASESSNTHLQEKVVFGDENSGRSETKMSSTTSSSTSQVISSSSTVEYDDSEPAAGNRYLTDSRHHNQQQQHQEQQQRLVEEQIRQQQQLQQQHEQRTQEQRSQQQRYVQEQQQQQQHHSTTEQYNQSRQESNTTSNVETQQRFEENKRYVDMDKASPEYQRHVQYLMAQPGEVISNTVEYPKPNVKMITTVKRLPDGTIVKNKRYETEELRPANEEVRQQRTTTSTTRNQTNNAQQRRVQEDERSTTNSPQYHKQPVDVVDNVETVRRQQQQQQQQQHADEVTTESYSTVKKSSRRFSTETTSETIEEFADDRSSPIKPTKQDFSTHGFPSVKAHKPTQEYPTDRPHPHSKPHPQSHPQSQPQSPRQPTNDFSTHGFPSVRANKPTQEYPTDRPKPADAEYITTEVKRGPNGEEIIVVKSERTLNNKQKMSSERIIETEVVSDDHHQPALTRRPHHDDYTTQQIPSTRNGTPSSPVVREIAPRHGTPTREQPPADGYPSTRSPTKPRPDYGTHGFPSVRDTTSTTTTNRYVEPYAPNTTTVDGEVVTKVSSSSVRTAKHNTNTERIIETELVGDYDHYAPNTPAAGGRPRKPEDFSTHGFPSVRSAPRSSSTTPSREQPSSPRRSQPDEDFSTHGFPSVRSPTKSTPDSPTKRIPTTNRSPTRKPSTQPGGSTGAVTTKRTTTNNTTTESSRKLVHKEKEVDAAHRAFAASLRSSSPVESVTSRRDSNYSDHPNRQTPRSSVSSTKTYNRRDTREGSHDSNTPSEVSRFSSTTVTRTSPAKTVSKTVVTKQQHPTVVKTRTVTGSSETIDLIPQRSSKSPSSPGKVPTSPLTPTAPAANTTKSTITTVTTNNKPIPVNQTTVTTTTTSTTTTSNKNNEVPKPDQSLPQSKPSTPSLPSNVERSRIGVTDSVAARRNIFENRGASPKPSRPQKPLESGRRPSYMDHTKSSLEHIRRDSLEINKSNYTRKSSVEDDGPYERKPNSAVKFEEPNKRAVTPRKESNISISEDVEIEEIFDLEVLERLLDSVTSYELRRRIRAQIRLVKKNIINTTSLTDAQNTTTQQKTSRMTTYSTQSQKEEEDSEYKKHHTKSSPLRSHSPSVSHRPYEKNQPERETRDRSPRDRSLSPNTKTIRSSRKEVRHVSGPQTITSKYTRTEHVDYGTVRKQNSNLSSDDQFESSPPGKPPVKPRDRSHSPIQPRNRDTPRATSGLRSPTSEPRDRSRSPQHTTSSNSTLTRDYVNQQNTVSHKTTKQSPERRTSPVGKAKIQSRDRSPQTHKSGSQRVETMTKTTSVRSTTQSPERRTSRPKTDDKATPIWADRRNVLKTNTTSSTGTKKTPIAPNNSSTKATRTTTMTSSSSTSSSQQRRQTKQTEEDSITSSYGIGPTDENGLPLFGIRALKKKPQSAVPCETTEDVTGYVIEEKYYSDNKSPPKVERKELIYSTNADELLQLQKQVDSRKSSKDDGSVVVREFKKIDRGQNESTALTSAETDDFASTKYVRRGSVKEMSEKFISKESSQSVTESKTATNGTTYPKAGLILRTNSRLSSKDASSSEHEAEPETEDSESNEVCSVIDVTQRGEHDEYINESESECESVKIRQKSSSKMSSSSRTQSTRSFLNSGDETRIVTSVDDVLERMRNADNVVEEGDTAEDQEARALLNKFLGASVIMHGVESALPMKQQQTKTTTTTKYANRGDVSDNHSEQAVKTTRITKTIKSGSSSSPVTRTTCDIEEIWDEEILKQLLEQASTYEERRKIRARLRELMAEREAQQQQQAGASTTTTERTETKKEKDGAVVTTTTKVTTRTVTGSSTGTAPKQVSPFAKFRQLDKQNSLQSPKSPTTPTPTTPGGSAPLFKFTDPALNARAATFKDQLLQWCQNKTQEYENVQITNFSSSWSDGLAFCALIHHFLPDAFDYSKLTQQTRRHNFELAFTVADEKAGIAPLLDVEDMVVMRRPDWKCVFVYVQSIYRRFRNCQ